MTIKQLEGMLEAVLFAMGQSVSLKKLAAAIEQDERTTKRIIENMMLKYAEEDRGICIIELDGAYQMCTKSACYDALIRVAAQPTKTVLTDTQIETLAIIAYKQPVTKTQIENVRGVKCDFAVNKLIEYGLIEEAGRLDAPGRPIVFATTELFLRRFGLSNLTQLPEWDEAQIAEIREETEAELVLSCGLSVTKPVTVTCSPRNANAPTRLTLPALCITKATGTTPM